MRIESGMIGSLTVLSLLLGACSNGEVIPTVPTEDAAASSDAAMETAETFEGTLVQAGISVYMEGTHRLDTGIEGDVVLLESDAVDLDQYIGSTVRVTGIVRPTVEAGGVIVDVTDVEQLSSPVLLEPAEPAASSAPAEPIVDAETARGVASSAPLLEPAPTPVAAASSSAPALALAPASSSAPSLALLPASSSSAPAVASSAPGSAQSQQTNATAAAMAKASVNASTFTQVFCTRHVGFCVPLHKSWYYNSFGATSSSLWHVEVSSQVVEQLGDGPLVINLLSGTLSDSSLDGNVVDDGGMAVGYRSWTDGRYFQVTAPAVLSPAVAYIVNNFTVYQPEASATTASASSVAGASSSVSQ